MLLSLTLLLAAALPPQQEAPQAGFDQATLQRKVDEILPRVARLRGKEFKKPVPAGVTTPDQFIQYAEADIHDEYGDEGLKDLGDAYILLGLIEPGSNLTQELLDLLRAQVGGYYDPKTKKFYMMSTFNEGGLADIIMAHELTHALDDQYYDLEGMYKRAHDLNSDAEFALRAVVEGSGTSLMNLYTFDGMKEGYLSFDPQQIQEMMEMSKEGLDDLPPYLIMTMALPYLAGNKFLVRKQNLLAAAAAFPTPADLDHAFAHPPLSSEQVLHFQKYWDPEQRDDPKPVSLPDLSAALGPGWSLVDQDTIGELGCFVLTEEDLPDLTSAQGQTGAWTNEAASGWGGDDYQLYRNAGGDRVLLWASVWDRPQDREEFLDAYGDISGDNHFLRTMDEPGDLLLLIYSDSKAEEAARRLRKAFLARGGDGR